MKNESFVVNRFYAIKGLGAKFLVKSVDVPQAENVEECLDLFDGTPEQKTEALVATCNRAVKKARRSSVIADSGANSDTMTAVKAIFKSFKTLNPSATDVEIAAMIPAPARDSLMNDGFKFGDLKELRNEYKKAVEAAGGTEESADDDEDDE